MARRTRGVAFAFAACAVWSANSGARAQTLALLHFTSFELSADKSTVAVGEPFHLTLAAHIEQRIDSLDNVQLPSLAGFEDLGDERRCMRARSGSGSDCVETLTIDANQPGDRVLGPAAVEFIDASNGHIGSRESNLVTIHVTGDAKAVPDQSADAPVSVDPISDLVWSGVRMFGVFVLVAMIGFALIRRTRRRAATPLPVVPPPVPVVQAPTGPPDWSVRMRELGSFLADEPTRARAVAVRAELRAHVGAGDRETIADLVRRGAANGDDAIMTALVAVERAAFCEDANVADAAREALPFLMR